MTIEARKMPTALSTKRTLFFSRPSVHCLLLQLHCPTKQCLKEQQNDSDNNDNILEANGNNSRTNNRHDTESPTIT